ncbi:hypothetical protein BDZ90DRAFT_230996 [Jaminaea rosea]|uniref:K Homology domain-containing protein n=1 Tax=Jaminaea rosea TaxID=1569628 RepID=A0A316UYL2_9BASI|nr:hypothetical protein BDZ90DRAFT_230996 [Jaminaea rosea]PWN28993.1 hypothetical protein BDZ90DRAFT_230996 [Jaminaea rosea]
MVSAAELQRMHEQANSAPNAVSAAGNQAAPMADPFPSLTEDPFPAMSNGQGPHSSAAAAANGTATSARKSAQGNQIAQPDFNSQSAFPSLGASAPAPKGQWGQKLNTSKPASAAWSGSTPVIQRPVFQESLSIPFKEDTNAKVSAAMTALQKKYKNSIKVEASTTRSTSTTNFVIKGTDQAAVKAARKELTVSLARRVTLEVMVPQSLRAFVIGAKGKNFKNITEQTGCRVNMPRQEGEAAVELAGPRDEVDFDNDEQIAVSIEGDEVNAQQAAQMIQAIVAERTSRTTQRITTVEHIFYPFIAGAKGANVARIEAEVGSGDVSVRVPPRAAFLHPKDAEDEEAHPRRERDLSIIVSGDRAQVQAVVQAIEAQVEDMKREFRCLSISVPKRQHRFLVGDAANDILASSGCSVELAPQDDPSDQVTIRGPQARLPMALTAVMEKANAVKVDVVDIVAAHRSASDALQHAKNLLRWLQVSGKLPKKQGVQVFTPRPALVESSGNVQIEIVGAEQADVAEVRSSLDRLVKGTPPHYVDTLDVDPLLHALLIGKKGANLKEYERKGVDALFPPPSTADGEGRSDIILIYSPTMETSDKKARDAEAKRVLAEVKADLLKASQQAADLKTETLNVPSKYHRTILGPGGSTLNAVLGEERIVAVRVGNSKGQTGADDTITIRGPSTEVDRVAAALRKIAKDAEEDAIVNGHEATFSVDPAHVKHLVGKSGAAITKLREELGVRVDFDDAAATNGAAANKKSAAKVQCKIVGRKENVEEAHKRLLAQAEKLADEREETLKVPQNLHSAIIGKGGVWVTRLQDNHGVRIEFPRQGGAAKEESVASSRAQKADEVIIRGGKKGVAAAKAEILELLEYEKENNNVAELSVSTASLPRILGKSGATVNQIRDDTGAQIDVDQNGSGEKEKTTTIRLRGTNKAIAAAKAAITAIDAEVKGEETFAIHIPSKYHGQLIGPGGQGIRDLIARATGSQDTASGRSATQLVQFPRRGEQNADVVTVRGPSGIARKIKAELESSAKVFTERVCHGFVAPPEQQRLLIGRGGSRRAELESQFGVRLVFPGRAEHGQEEVENSAEIGEAPQEHIVKVLGKVEDVEALKKELASNAAATRIVKIPRSMHKQLATADLFRKLRSSYGVNVDAPRVRDSGKSQGGKVVMSTGGNAAAEARIDDEETQATSADDLPFELLELGGESESTDEASVDWTLTFKGNSSEASDSLQAAHDHLLSAISGSSTISHEGRLIVPAGSIPRIIGKGGSGLRAIQDEHACSVEIPREGKPRGLCIIKGSKEAVMEAKDRIAEIATQPGRY